MHSSADLGLAAAASGDQPASGTKIMLPAIVIDRLERPLQD